MSIAEQKTIETALFALGHEQPVGAEDRGEQQADREHPGALLPADGVLDQAEVEDDEGGDGEDRHRRDGLQRAQLDGEVLAQDRPGDPHRYSSRMLARSIPDGGPR
jgi:hypothetical protein